MTYSEAPQIGEIKDDFELIDLAPDIMVIDVELMEDEYQKQILPGVKDRKIPNTSEILNLRHIFLSQKQSDNSAARDLDVSITESITILSPRDVFSDVNIVTSDTNNMYLNRGKIFELYALKDSTNGFVNVSKKKQANDIIKIAEFQLSNRLTPDNRYDVIYFVPQSALKPISYVDKQSGFESKTCLAYCPDNKTQYQYFGIGIPDDSKFYPGDDIQLRFGFPNYTMCKTEISDDDMLYLYDKKMFWRANLYINENIKDSLNTDRGAFTGYLDWNNFYPWIDSSDNQWITGICQYSCRDL